MKDKVYAIFWSPILSVKGEISVNYHLVLTRRCNLNCQYCHGGEDTENTEIQYSLDDLVAFLEKDRTSVTLMLYGGEPTLRIPMIIQLMDRFPNTRFMLQTNALLLNRIPIEYVVRFHSILVSIDGMEQVTDRYRSEGVYQEVLDNVRWLRNNQYEGDVVARMTISQASDIYRDVRHLLDIRNPSFDHIHWQLNVIWDAEGNWNDFEEWVNTSYNPGISRLVEDWVRRMEDGIVEGIVPFIPITYSLLTGELSEIRCGSGIDTFAIHVDGSIGVCPISPDWEFSLVGDIWNSEPRNLHNIMKVEEPCPSCGDYGICGGRCLFANKQRLWGDEGFDKVCGTVKYLISSIRKKIPLIHQYIKDGRISIDNFKYPEFNNGCEVIP
ncbi:TIGR04084 family radical SAM/SPASM domain-containing protein [Candidatus Thorarchaeota archaeon]|nr:MAG: TIGR04084 family radical SAM/SPASM domain-containing protein [Candidatus Thorarchaeota archaeon]